MTSVSLTTRLTSLKEARNTTHTLIARLSKLPRQPGSDNSEVRVELSAEIHQLLKEQEEELELLRQDLDDFSVGRDKEKEAEKARLEVGVQRLGEDLRLCIPSSPLLSLVGLRLTQHHDDRYRARTHYRKAQLQAKRNAELARQKERELLFAGAPQDGESHGQGGRSRKQRGGPVSQDEQLVNASGDVTAALRQTHQLMQSELSRSQFAHDTLKQSTEALQTLSESYSSLSTLLDSSRSLLSSLLRSQKSDTWYLETAFYVLVGTIIWLIFRRFLYGPLWWLVWLPLKLTYRASWGAIAALGSLGTRNRSVTPADGTLVLKPSATGDFPKWEMVGSDAPRVVAGGGGKGASAQVDHRAHSATDPSTMVEKVGRMAEEGQQAQEAGRREAEGEYDIGSPEHQAQQKAEVSEPARNRKKRMWEEDKEAEKHQEKLKDEL